MRKYNSQSDYQILKAAAAVGKVPSLTNIAIGLQAAGIEWPGNFNSSQGSDAIAIDADAGRAWRELGFFSKSVPE